MSYWVYLEDDNGQPVVVGRHAEGGTYVLGGTTEAELNVTYNYAALFREAWADAGGTFDGEGDGTLGAMLGGKKASEVCEKLVRAVDALGIARSGDYWAATPGNAGYALSILRDWATEHPDANFRVS